MERKFILAIIVAENRRRIIFIIGSFNYAGNEFEQIVASQGVSIVDSKPTTMFAPPRRGFSRIGRLSDSNVSAGNVSITVNRREASFLVTRGSRRAKGAPRWRNYRGVNERPSKFPLITVEKIFLPLSRRSSPILVNFVNEKIMNTN